MTPKRPEMLAGPITRDVLARHLNRMLEETRAAIVKEQREGKVPQTSGAYKSWVDSWDERKRAIQALQVMVLALSPNAEILPAEYL